MGIYYSKSESIVTRSAIQQVEEQLTYSDDIDKFYQRAPKGEWEFQGYRLRNMKHGLGEFTFHYFMRGLDKRRYVLTGEWINNIITSGKIVYANGDTYEGEIEEVSDETFDFTAKIRYKIYYHRKQGKGKFIQAATKYVLEGEFDHDNFTGHGITQCVNGDIYDGNWKNGKYHGKGKLIKKIVDNETNECSFVPCEGYYYSGNLCKDMTDEMLKLLFPNEEIGEETKEGEEEQVEETQKKST
jgi:hypothetical protein